MRPWGYWATLLWGVLVFVIAQAAGVMALWWWYSGHLAEVAAQPYSGIPVTLVTLVTNPIEIALLMAVAALRQRNVSEYLGLIPPALGDVKVAAIAIVLFIAAGDAIIYLANQSVVPPFEIEAYETARAAGWLPALAFATVIAAPAGEEILFRGFLFRGWVRSKRGVLIGIPLISLIFASLHIQYDIFGMLQIFAVGLLFGWLRWRSGSTWLTIGCHAFVNLESSIETVVKVHWFP
jgi:uncharacterized protein